MRIVRNDDSALVYAVADNLDPRLPIGHKHLARVESGMSYEHHWHMYLGFNGWEHMFLCDGRKHSGTGP